MEQFYYIPVSSFSFPELMSAEAISPTGGDVAGIFAGRGSYPTRTTGEIPVNPVRDVLVAYSKAVVWEYADGSVMDYPLVIKIPGDILDGRLLARLELPSLPSGVDAWAYPKTVFFPSDGRVRYIFRTDEEMCQQIQRLSPFQEVKDISLVKDSCESFEELRTPPESLPDCISEEIRREVSRLGLMLLDKVADVQRECRTGACLGYSIGRASDTNETDSVLAETLTSTIGDKKTLEKACQMLHDIRLLQHNLARLVSTSSEVDYAPCDTSFTKYFKYKGRGALSELNGFEPVLKECVDFIAAYPPEKWNWYGNEERFIFMRDLWNAVLKPSLQKQKIENDKIDAMRNEVENVCRHFKSPNSIGAAVSDLHSPIVQAIYIVLQCSGDARMLASMKKTAMRPGYCLALYGAFKGYAYFSRLLIPARLPRVPTRVSREDILRIVDSFKGKGKSSGVWKKIVAAVDKAMSLELKRQSPKAFLYILNNLLSRSDPLYLRLKGAFESDKSEYDYAMFKTKVKKLIDGMAAVTDEQNNAVMLAIELEDKRHDPLAFKYILDDCIREGGSKAAYRDKASLLMSRLDMLYGGMPSDIGDAVGGSQQGEPEAVIPLDAKVSAASSNKSSRRTKRKATDQPSLFDDGSGKI